MFNYLFFSFLNNRTNNPKYYAVMAITVLEGVVLMAIGKVTVIELYDYSRFIEISESGQFRVLIIIPVFAIGLLNHFYYSEKRINKFKTKWSNEKLNIRRGKFFVLLMLILTLGFFLPSILNTFRDYW